MRNGRCKWLHTRFQNMAHQLTPTKTDTQWSTGTGVHGQAPARTRSRRSCQRVSLARHVQVRLAITRVTRQTLARTPDTCTARPSSPSASAGRGLLAPPPPCTPQCARQTQTQSAPASSSSQTAPATPHCAQRCLGSQPPLAPAPPPGQTSRAPCPRPRRRLAVWPPRRTSAVGAPGEQGEPHRHTEETGQREESREKTNGSARFSQQQDWATERCGKNVTERGSSGVGVGTISSTPCNLVT